jgi:hypothetical protein
MSSGTVIPRAVAAPPAQCPPQYLPADEKEKEIRWSLGVLPIWSSACFIDFFFDGIRDPLPRPKPLQAAAFHQPLDLVVHTLSNLISNNAGWFTSFGQAEIASLSLLMPVFAESKSLSHGHHVHTRSTEALWQVMRSTRSYAHCTALLYARLDCCNSYTFDESPCLRRALGMCALTALHSCECKSLICVMCLLCCIAGDR